MSALKSTTPEPVARLGPSQGHPFALPLAPADAGSEAQLPPGSHPGPPSPSPGRNLEDPLRVMVRELKARLADIAAREREIERREQETRGQSAGSSRAEREAELERRAQELDAQAAGLVQRQRELERCGLEIEQRRHELDRQRRELELQRRRADERQIELDGREQALHARQLELERVQSERLAGAERLAEREQALRVRVARQRDLLASRRRELARLKEALAARHHEAQQALEQQARALQEQAAAQQARQSALDERTIQLNTRDLQLREQAQLLAERGRRLEEAQARLAADADGLRQREQQLGREIEEQRGALEQATARFEERQAALLARERDLELRSSAVAAWEDEQKRRQDELEARRRLLEDQGSALRERAERLDERERWLSEQTAGLQEDRRRLARLEAELSASRRDLESRAAALQQERVELGQRQREAEDAEAQLARHRGEMDQQQREIERARRELEQLRAELELARHALLEREQEAAQARQALSEQERSLIATRDALAAEGRRVQEQAAELERRRAELEAERQRLEEAGRQAERRMDETLALHARLEAREAELQQHVLHIQMDAQRLQHERERLRAQEEELAAIRESAEADLRHVRITLERGPGRAAAWPTPGAARTVWLRGLAAGLAAAVLVGAGWLAVERPVVCQSLELTVRETRAAGPTAVYEHAARLARPGLLGEYLAEEHQRRRWAELQGAVELSVTPAPESRAVVVSLRSGPDPSTVAGELLRAAAQMYAARGGDLRRTMLSESQEAQAVLLAHLDGELLERRWALQQAQAALDRTGAAPSWDAVLAEASAAQVELSDVVERLREARVALADLRSQDSPRGTVAPEALRDALAADAVLSEDGRELRSAAREYQTELALAMLAVLDPLRELRARVTGLLKVVEEQRALQPPAEVGAVLEGCGMVAAELDRGLAEFAVGWDRDNEAVQRARSDPEIVALIAQQAACADAARGLVDRMRRTLAELRERLGGRSDGTAGGTREIVVSAVLRGELNRVAEALAVLDEAARAVDLAHNFRLEAQDRRLRGLLMRIQQREEAIAATLQHSADQAAAAEHEARLRDLAGQAGALEQRRDELLAALTGATARLQDAARTVLARKTLEAELAREQSEIARLESERQRVASAASAATTIELPADVLDVAARAPELVAGVHRWRNAALAGSAAGALCLLCGLLMLVRAPLTRLDAEETVGTYDLPPAEAVASELR